MMERHALMRLKGHPNIVSLIHTWSDLENCFIATEYCPNGELWESCRRCGEPEIRAKFFFTQIIQGLSYMHRMGIVHRDLKAENILISKDSVVKICDFGSSRDLFNPTMPCTSNADRRRISFQHYVGTPNFIAPEALENIENDELSDIWSLGCLFYQVLLGIPPFVAGSEYLVYLRMRAEDLMFPSTGLSEEAINLVQSIVVHDREKRPSLGSIRTHRFFSNTPEHLVDLTSEEETIKRIARDQSELDECVFTNNEYALGRLRMVGTVREWERLSLPGTGTEILDHLNLPPNLLGRTE